VFGRAAGLLTLHGQLVPRAPSGRAQLPGAHQHDGWPHRPLAAATRNARFVFRRLTSRRPPPASASRETTPARTTSEAATHARGGRKVSERGSDQPCPHSLNGEGKKLPLQSRIESGVWGGYCLRWLLRDSRTNASGFQSPHHSSSSALAGAEGLRRASRSWS